MATEQLVTSVYNPNELFDRVKAVTGQYANDPETLWGASVESLPQAVSMHGPDDLDDYAPIISGELFVEYGVGTTYRMAGATATIGLAEPGFTDYGVDWQEHPMLAAKVQFMATSELHDGYYEESENFCEDDIFVPASVLRQATVFKEGSNKAHNEEDIQTLHKYVSRYSRGGLPRIVNMYAQAVAKRRNYSQWDRSESQYRADYLALRNFVINYAGRGAIAIASQVPATINGTPEVVVVRQDHTFRTPDSLPSWPREDYVDRNERLAIEIEPESSSSHKQEEWVGGQRTMTVGNQATLPTVLDALEQSRAALDRTQENYFNMPITVQHASRCLRLFTGFEPQSSIEQKAA